MNITLRIAPLDGTALGCVFSKAVDTVCMDNAVYLTAMVAEGQQLVDTMAGLGVAYSAWRPSDNVVFRGYEQVMRDRAWACGDAAAYEAAVLRVKYGIDVSCIVRKVQDQYWHAYVKLPDGTVYDPTMNYQKGMRNFPAEVRKQRRTLNGSPATCSVVRGYMVCNATNK